ncbi:YjzC family protein [Flavisolibacter ginsenosidimutans]|uniref:YjzC family protein n=1 Tax=Flavisolibacter ginsenosidimutans TaxID=661481 RepID=A0A5B8UJV9_9BACT|nr:YjzC family protein [Flavisolibacter ginsenosidimutans]QEC56706.1 YjzC family protein [Flavisolibacter ginsenosidimutans]
MSYRPGEKVPQSGIYEEQTVYGSKVTEVTCVKGEHFPPTEFSGYHYKLVRAAVHKPSKG